MNIRVVVADDFPLVRTGVVRALDTDPGIDVVAQSDNGIEALELTRKHEPDVLVLDLRMPGLGGMSVLEQVRRHCPDTKVIIMTASEKVESLLDAITAGAAGYLSKRSTAEELRQAVISAHGGGSVLSPELATHLLREFSHASKGEGMRARPVLAPRELEVIRLLSQGLTDDEIAKELFISPRTVQNYLHRAREKTGVRRRAELTRWAVEHAIS
jgi:DNA-binding NarL/FixJ family response regulator